MQIDPNVLAEWCLNNNLHLNLSKCYCMSIARTHNCINFQYVINGHLFRSIDSVRDLGVLMDSSFSYALHINTALIRLLRL